MLFVLWLVVAVLVVLWLVGLLLHIAGAFIHLLLVIAIIVAIWRLVMGARAGSST